MLTHIYIKNYALIQELDLPISSGFTAITGETGAGKSILLGALGLALGNRANLKALGKNDSRCVIEITFRLSLKSFRHLFDNLELDFDEETIIRREISPSGKSRIFVNDSPVNLDTVSILSKHLIDIHSQHQNLLLTDEDFQLELLDSFAKNEDIRTGYANEYQKLLGMREQLMELEGSSSEQVDLDYIQFLSDELEKADIKEGELKGLEEEFGLLENVETIKSNLESILSLSDNEEVGVAELLRRIEFNYSAVRDYDSVLAEMSERLSSLRIEFEDIRSETESRAQSLDADPQRFVELSDRLNLIQSLLKKHNVNNEAELMEKKEQLDQQIELAANKDEKVTSLKAEILRLISGLKVLAGNLTQSRESVTSDLESEILLLLHSLNLPEARFKIDITQNKDFGKNGIDTVKFLFSANRGQPLHPISQVASGGELSRVMLAIKAVMSRAYSLPSIIFDEIDTGVSGETAGKISDILKDLGGNMQVLAITHLPQIAANGRQHLKVVKQVQKDLTETKISTLSEEDRVSELARLLSGERITDAAIDNAKELLSAN